MTLLSFKKKDQVEIDQNEALEKSKKAVDDAIAKARLCLHSPLFKEYAKEYAEAEKSVIERIFIIDTRETDLTRYAFKMKEAIGELRHLKALYNSVRLRAKIVK